MSSYQYRKFLCGDKTVVRSSYLHNGISFAGDDYYKSLDMGHRKAHGPSTMSVHKRTNCSDASSDTNLDNNMGHDDDSEDMCVVSAQQSSAAQTEETGEHRHKQRRIHRNKRRKLSDTSTNKTTDEELCLICGDRASGYHYNALSCEGCKGFFRRSITRGATYQCKNGGNCEMDMWMRRRCQACRIKRCVEVGMKPECLLSDDQCKARDARRKARIGAQPPKPAPEEEKPVKQGPDIRHATPPPEDIMENLPETDKQLIERLVFYQEKYELPEPHDVKMMEEVKVESLKKMPMSDAIFQQMAGMTILVTHLVVEFAKTLPSFLSLSKDDQIALLKGSACEVMMFRTARRYDVKSDTIVFADGSPYTKENMRMGGLDDYVDDMFDFCRGMGLMEVDNSEYALLTAISIFSVRPNLTNHRKVEAVQEAYASTLERYVKLRRPHSKYHFAHLLLKMTELRSLSHQYEKVLENMKVRKGPLPPLLTEYFDVK